ncbi:MAG: hypothetical protein AAF570_14015, partial [Bacteroidota bacterium]
MMFIAYVRQWRRALARVTLVALTLQLFTPAFAGTGGPQQPEFSSFQAIGTPTGVNPFTGDFSYQLPLMTVPGPHGLSYPISLTYQSGVTPEQEASWVGFGWSLNPGAVKRQRRGIPDDWRGQSIHKVQEAPAYRHISANLVG